MPRPHPDDPNAVSLTDEEFDRLARQLIDAGTGGGPADKSNQFGIPIRTSPPTPPQPPAAPPACPVPARQPVRPTPTPSAARPVVPPQRRRMQK
jgi:hypothetical protein